MRKKTDEQILNEVALDVMKMFGAQPKPKRRTRTKDPLEFITWKAGGKHFRSRQKALATGEKPVRHTFDAEFLWEAWLNEGYEVHIEDMTHEQYIETIEKKYKEWKGE